MRIVGKSVSAAITIGMLKWTAVKNSPTVVAIKKFNNIYTKTAFFFSMVSGVSVAATYLYFVVQDYKKIHLPLRELENNLNLTDQIVNEIEKTTTPSLSYLEFAVNCIEPTKFRARLVAFSLAEVYRCFNHNDIAGQKYEECKGYLKTGSKCFEMLMGKYLAFRFEERTASDVMLMPWKCDAQILQLKLVAIKGAQAQQNVLTHIMKEAEEIISGVCEANYVDTVTKKDFLASFISMLGQRRSMVPNATKSEVEEAMKSSLVLINTAFQLLLTNDPLSGKWYKTKMSYYEKMAFDELVVEANNNAEKIAINNDVACRNNDVRATVLYNWIVISRNCEEVNESIKSKAREYAWDCAFYKGVRPKTARNTYFMVIDQMPLKKLLSEITAHGHKKYANIVRNTSQHTDLSMPFAIALAVNGRYEEALAMYLYLDHTHLMNDYEILSSCKNLEFGGANNYNGHYSFLAFLLYALGKKDLVSELLQYVKDVKKLKLTADHELFLKALQPSMTSTLLKELKVEIGENLSKWKNQSHLWWLICCLQLVPDSDKEAFAKELKYVEDLRNALS